MYARCAFPNARCALTRSQNDSEREVQRRTRRLDILGARSAQNLEPTKFEETTKKNTRRA
jgi:hypothetical protein